MPAIVNESGAPKNITSTGAVTAKPCNLLGFYVNSTSSGTLIIKDGTVSTGAAISGTITPSVGFNPYPAGMNIGIYVTVGGTIDVTFFYAPTAAA